MIKSRQVRRAEMRREAFKELTEKYKLDRRIRRAIARAQAKEWYSKRSLGGA